MDLFKNKVLKFVLGGIAIFFVGIFIGYQLNGGMISSIQGFLFNAVGYATSTNATNSNATNSNATNSNATNSNATNSNATASNATNSNARSTDNIIYLQQFSFKSNNAKPQDKIYLTFATTGATLTGASVRIVGSRGSAYTINIQSISNNPYIIIPSTVLADTYTINEVLLMARNSNNSNFSKLYGTTTFNFNSKLTITNNTETITLKSISLDKDTVEKNDKVYINIDTNVTLTELKLQFGYGENQLVLHASSLSDNPYVEIPTDAIAGEYELSAVTLTTKNGSKIYSRNRDEGTTYFALNSSLKILNGNDGKYIYNNEDLTTEILAQLYDLESGSEITINANSNSIISEELFNSIKGKNKKLILNYHDNQLIFTGSDISSSKTIDINITSSLVKSDSNIGNLVNDGIVVTFADNGNLPGKALVRIKATDEMKQTLGNKKVYVYLYNEKTNMFSVIDLNVNKTTDDYYEFTITHNSKYILVNEKLADTLITTTDANVVSFLKNDRSYLALIIVGVIIVAGVSITVIVMNKNKKTKKD